MPHNAGTGCPLESTGGAVEKTGMLKNNTHSFSIHFKTFVAKINWWEISGEVYGESPLKDKTSVPGLFGDLSYKRNKANKEDCFDFLQHSQCKKKTDRHGQSTWYLGQISSKSNSTSESKNFYFLLVCSFFCLLKTAYFFLLPNNIWIFSCITLSNKTLWHIQGILLFIP